MIPQANLKGLTQKLLFATEMAIGAMLCAVSVSEERETISLQSEEHASPI